MKQGKKEAWIKGAHKLQGPTGKVKSVPLSV